MIRTRVVCKAAVNYPVKCVGEFSRSVTLNHGQIDQKNSHLEKYNFLRVKVKIRIGQPTHFNGHLKTMIYTTDMYHLSDDV